MLHNWTYIWGNFTDWSLSAYTGIPVLGTFFWPLIFTAVIGYVYLKQQSFTAAAIVTLILVAAFGNTISGVPYWFTLMHILVALAITGLFLVFLTKLRR